MNLSNRVALVSGARGIGGATAKLLAQRGANVVVAYRQNQVAAQQLMDEIIANGGLASAAQVDVLEAESLQQLVGEIVEQWGHLDILVSNAGGGWLEKPFDQLNWQEYAAVVESELKAAFNMTRATLPLMMQQRSGRLIYIARLPASSGWGGFAAGYV